jgi:hypothetical protein
LVDSCHYWLVSRFSRWHVVRFSLLVSLRRSYRMFHANIPACKYGYGKHLSTLTASSREKELMVGCFEIASISSALSKLTYDSTSPFANSRTRSASTLPRLRSCFCTCAYSFNNAFAWDAGFSWLSWLRFEPKRPSPPSFSVRPSLALGTRTSRVYASTERCSGMPMRPLDRGRRDTPGPSYANPIQFEAAPESETVAHARVLTWYIVSCH